MHIAYLDHKQLIEHAQGADAECSTIRGEHSERRPDEVPDTDTVVGSLSLLRQDDIKEHAACEAEAPSRTRAHPTQTGCLS